MDEERQVKARLERIDGLRRAGAPPRTVLENVRALVAEGEAWLAAERTARRGGGKGTPAAVDGREAARGGGGTETAGTRRSEGVVEAGNL